MKNIFIFGLLLVSGISSAQSTMTVVMKDGNRVEYDMEKVDKVQLSSPAEGGEVADPVDLDLSVLWASHNIGGRTMSDAGSRLSFSEAQSNEWGDGWRLPTEDEWRELYEKCQWTWTVLDGISGRMVSSTNGASIFIPASGFQCDGSQEVLIPGAMGIYWTSDEPIDDGISPKATGFYFDSNSIYRIEYPKTNRFSVRLVKDNGSMASYHDMLILQLKDSNQMSFVINGNMQVQEKGDSLYLTSPTLSYTISRNNVRSYSFKVKVDYANIETLQEGGSNIKIEYLTRGLLKISGIREADMNDMEKSISVYNLQGQKQSALIEPQANSILVRFTSLPQSTYIINVKNVGSIKANN